MKLEDNKNWHAVRTANVRPYRFTHFYAQSELLEIETRFKALQGLRYIVYGYELCPTTGHSHLQGFMFFKNEKSGAKLIKELPGTILFTCDASCIANSKYCKKEGKVAYEWGKCPATQEEKGSKSAQIMEKCMEWARQGLQDEIEFNHPGVYMAHINNWDKVYFKAQARKLPNEFDGEMTGVWIVGPPGAAKSGHARKWAGPDFYSKVGNKEQWQHYRYQKNIILEDFDPTIKGMSYNLKIWTDRYKTIADLKYGSAEINPERWIVTSNYEIADCFDDPMVRGSMERRFPTVIRLTMKDGEEWVAMKKRKRAEEDEAAKDPVYAFGTEEDA